MEDIKFGITEAFGHTVWAVMREERTSICTVKRYLPIDGTNFTLEQLHELHTAAVAKRQPDQLIAWICKAIDNVQLSAALANYTKPQ